MTSAVKIIFITSAQWTQEFFTGETFKGQKPQKALVAHLINEMIWKFFKMFLKPQSRFNTMTEDPKFQNT